MVLTITDGGNIYFSKITLTDEKSPNSLTFEVPLNFNISMNEKVELFNSNNVKRFVGYVRDIEDKEVRKVTVKSPIVVLNDRTINKIYRGVSPESIIADVFSLIAPQITFTSEVTTGFTINKTYKDKRGTDIVQELMETFNGYIEEDLNFNAVLKIIGSDTSSQSITEGVEMLDGPVKTHTDSMFNKFIVIGKKVLNRTVEAKTGTNTVFTTTRKPIDIKITVGGTELTQTVPGSIEGDYEVDIENKEITFNVSRTDPIIEYSYETQVKASATASKSIIDEFFNGELKEKRIEVPYIETNDEAFELCLQLLEKFSKPLITGRWRVTNYNSTLYKPNTLIPVSDNLRNINRDLIIRSVERNFPGKMFVEVGDNLDTIIDWEKETTKRIKQLEDQQDNSDLLNEFAYVEENLKISYTTKFNCVKLRRYAEDTFYLLEDGSATRNQMREDGSGPVMREDSNPNAFTDINLDGCN